MVAGNLSDSISLYLILQVLVHYTWSQLDSEELIVHLPEAECSYSSLLLSILRNLTSHYTYHVTSLQTRILSMQNAI